MGSKPTDSGMMKQAGSGAQASDAALAAQANQNSAFAADARKTQFGSGGTNGGGTLSGFLDPSKLNVAAPTGTYKLQYNRFTQNNAQNYQNARGSLARTNAQRGFGSGPAGFAADQSRRLAQGQADTQGTGFADYADRSYQDALGNFWRANDALSGQGTGAMSAAIAGNQAAAGNYANLYNTASQPKPSALGAIVGGGLQAAGTVGAAAVCPVEGAKIALLDGSEIPVEDLRAGHELLGVDGQPCKVLEDPVPVFTEALEISSAFGRTRVSVSHTFILFGGGYEYAPKANGKHVLFGDKESVPVGGFIGIGKQNVYPLLIDGSHSYRCDGFWSLS